MYYFWSLEVREEGINASQRVREIRLLEEINSELDGRVSLKIPWDDLLLTERKLYLTSETHAYACKLYTNTKYMATNVYLMSLHCKMHIDVLKKSKYWTLLLVSKAML